MVFKERWGHQVLDINELHQKMLDFEVFISHLKLRELYTQVTFNSHPSILDELLFGGDHRQSAGVHLCHQRG